MKEVVEKIEDVVEVAADNIEETAGLIVEEIDEDVVEVVANNFKDDSADDDSEGENEIIKNEKAVEKIELIVVPMGWKSRAVDDSVPKGWKPRFVKCDV